MANQPTNAADLRYQKLALGIIGAGMLVTGAVMYIAAPTANVLTTATLIRVGLLLSVIWLAFDQVLQLTKYFPLILLGIGLAVLVIAAAKPNFGKVVLLICGALSALSLISKFLRPKQ